MLGLFLPKDEMLLVYLLSLPRPPVLLQRTSDGGNGSHNVSLPIILKKTKVGQILQDSCISLLLVPILLYWIQVSVSFNVLLYFGAEMATFCIKHIENRKIFF